MKKIALVLSVLALMACERPQYDVLLVCEDGARGQLLVDAKIYKDRADLNIKRLSQELLREKAQGSSAARVINHLWLYNQIPEIDDTITLSLPVNESGNYEIDGKISLQVGIDNLTGGKLHTLWHYTDNDLTDLNGNKIPNGIRHGGAMCVPVIDSVPTSVNISSDVKKCLSYITSQVLYDSEPTVDAPRRLRVYDENSGREMYIVESEWNEIFGGVKPSHFYEFNKYPNDAMQACDVAARLRAYIAAHIDAQSILQPQNPQPVGMEKITVIGE